MIRRIVKMEFHPEKVSEFEKFFNKNCEYIRNQEGCHELILLKEKEEGCVYFTHSLWVDQEALNKYRKTTLFGIVWKATKALFSEKARAWSCEEIVKLP